MKRLKTPWLDPFVYLLMAMVLGFMGGLVYGQAKCKTNLHNLQIQMLQDQPQCTEYAPCTCEEPMEYAFEPGYHPVSAYTSRVEETDDTPCISASGANICHMFYDDGTKICAMNGVPFGTVIHIDDYGACVVYDRMAEHKNGWVDIYMGYDLEAALEWGVQDVVVTEIK